MIRLNRATRRELDIVEAAVKGERPSSRYGRTYKRELLRSLRAFDAGLRWDSRAMRLHMRGRRAAALAAWRRANRHWARSRRHERRALRAIRRVVPD